MYRKTRQVDCRQSSRAAGAEGHDRRVMPRARTNAATRLAFVRVQVNGADNKLVKGAFAIAGRVLNVELQRSRRRSRWKKCRSAGTAAPASDDC